MWFNYFDNIYLISLIERRGEGDRFRQTVKQLFELQIPYTVVDAIKDQDGARGLRQSMKKVFSHAIDKQYQRILVFEDDVMLSENVNEVMNKCISDLRKLNWLSIYMGCNLLSAPEKITDNLLCVRSAYATHAVGYTREAMQIIIGSLNEDTPYDMILFQKLQILNRCYCSNPMAATQRLSKSDIADYDEYRKNPSLDKYLDHASKSINWDMMMKERFELFTKKL